MYTVFFEFFVTICRLLRFYILYGRAHRGGGWLRADVQHTPQRAPGVILGSEAGILDYAINYMCYTLILYVSYCVMTCLILYVLYYAITCLINSIILIMHIIT